MTDVKAQVGDRIKFSAPTRCGKAVATRKVKAVNPNSYEVGFHGWPNFIVRPGEVLTIYRGEREFHLRDKRETHGWF